MNLLLATAALLTTAAAAAEDNPATVFELPTVEVIGTTPLPDIGIPLRQVPGNVQTLGGRIEQQPTLDIGDVLNRNLGGVNINDSQGNARQADIDFRGFTASPVLGTPQGMSVFIDGVRINEAFGDTVNWDLIPQSAIANITLIPGSNPVFGLNTLGGALSLNTKSGFDAAGSSARAETGSFGRRSLEFETGDHGERADYFVTGTTVDDHGWGQHNPSRVDQLFAKTGYQDQATDIDLSVASAVTNLQGNQSLPLSLLDQRSQSYTWPDIQRNRMLFVNLKGSRFVTGKLLLAGNIYYRRLSTDALNSNVNNQFDPTLAPGPGNQPTGNAIERIEQRRPGASLQLTDTEPLGDRRNVLAVGISVDGGATDFLQYSQQAGSSRDTSSDQPLALATSLAAHDSYRGLYATDNLALGDDDFATLSARYNAASVRLSDRLGAALDGDHSYRRLNPAVGLAHNADPRVTVFANYSEGMRVPTPVELSCADPGAPCSLPNAFAADPDLKPVISRTWEAGARGSFGASGAWNAALFQTGLADDIQFVSSGGGAVSSGYFRNVGRTRRRGAEFGIDGKLQRVALSLHGSLVSATYQSAMLLNSPNNSSAAPISCATCTDIGVQPGDRIPGLPAGTLKLRVQIDLPHRAAVGLSLHAQSSQYARGDENNLDRNGPVPGFALVHLDGRMAFAPGWQAFARVDNLFDRRTSTFGVLGRNVFTAPGGAFDPTASSWRSEQFRSLAAPRGAWIGVEFRFGAGGADAP